MAEYNDISLSNGMSITVKLPCVLITLDSACDHCISSAKLLSVNKGPIELHISPSEDIDDPESYFGNDPRSYGNLHPRSKISLPFSKALVPDIYLDFISKKKAEDKRQKKDERQEEDERVIISSGAFDLDLRDFSNFVKDTNDQTESQQASPNPANPKPCDSPNPTKDKEGQTPSAEADEPYKFIYFANGGEKKLTLEVPNELDFELKSGGKPGNPGKSFTFKAGALVCTPYKDPKQLKEAAQAQLLGLLHSTDEKNLYCEDLIRKLQLNHEEAQLLREYIDWNDIDEDLFEYVQFFYKHDIELSCALDLAEYCMSDDGPTLAHLKALKRKFNPTATLQEWIQELRDDGKIN